MGPTTQTISVGSSGNYWVKVITGNCSGTDTIAVNYDNNPSVNIGPDTAICFGQPITLNAGNAGATYLWSTGATTETISPANGGTYWVNVSFGICEASDTIVITTFTTPTVNLGPDIKLCYGLDTSLNAGNPGLNYLWNNGETTKIIKVAASSDYWVEVFEGGCFNRDTVKVTIDAKPFIDLNPDTVICPGDELTIGTVNNFISYSWLPEGQISKDIIINQPGTYILTVMDTDGCPASASVFVQEFCQPTLFVPNCFTPNGNGINDLFMAYGMCVVEFNMY